MLRQSSIEMHQLGVTSPLALVVIALPKGNQRSLQATVTRRTTYMARSVFMLVAVIVVIDADGRLHNVLKIGLRQTTNLLLLHILLNILLLNILLLNILPQFAVLSLDGESGQSVLFLVVVVLNTFLVLFLLRALIAQT